MDPINLGKFPQGINNVSPDTDLPEGSLVSAVNVNIDKEGNVSRRKGYTKVYSGSNIHSLYDRYFVENGVLKYLEKDNTATTVTTGIPVNRFLTWATVHDDLYYSDGEDNKIVGKGEWGIKIPQSNPQLNTATGLLNAGIYQVTIGYINSTTGEVGGAGLAKKITIGDSGGILVSSIPVSPEGYDVAIYVSEPNGEQFYQNGIVLNGLTDYLVINAKKNTKVLDTQFMDILPGGHIITHFKARMYVARDNVLWYSEVFRYGLRHTTKNFFQFPEKITIVQPVTDGLFVVADKTYFLQGTEPKDMRQVVVSVDKGIPGTGLSVNGGVFGLDSDMTIGYWYSDKGAVLGLPGGGIKQLTEDKLAMNEVGQGTSMLKEEEGIKQVVTNFFGKGQASGFKFGAQATSYIIRNGVVID